MPIDIPMRFNSEKLLWVVKNVLSKPECDDLIAEIESSAPKLATDNPIYRDQDRVIKDDPVLAKTLFDRLKEHLPNKMGDLEVSSLNSRFRLYRYRPGQQFLPHTDHWYQPNKFEITLHTVLIYLNDGFKGGETDFSKEHSEKVVPVVGSAAIFQHKITHAGCKVKSGVKYALRSDVIYKSKTEIRLLGVEQ